MPTTIFDEWIESRPRLKALTVEQYHRMIETGILLSGDPYELLDGQLVHKDRSAEGADPRTVGDDHIWAVTALQELDPRLRRLGCYMRVQQPLALPPFDEPEPDGAIVRGTKDNYRARKPGPDDVLCVIEVADASLRRDRVTKLRIYADSGLPCYVIVNLPERVVEVYEEPAIGRGRYGRSQTLSGRQIVTFPTAAGKPFSVAVRRLLP